MMKRPPQPLAHLGAGEDVADETGSVDGGETLSFFIPYICKERYQTLNLVILDGNLQILGKETNTQ